METTYEYEQRAGSRAIRHLHEIESAPLRDRQEAREAFLDAMTNRPEIVGERVGWLLDGNYGQGEQLMARRVLAGSSRSNKRAQLTHLAGAFEWGCPPRMAAEAWKKLTKVQQRDLDVVLDMVIKAAEEE